MIYALIIVGGIVLIVGMFVLVRWGKLPPWTHRDVLAFAALVGTIGGALVLTLMKWQQSEKFNEQSDRLINELVRERKGEIHSSVGKVLETIIDSLTWDLKLTSVGIIVVLLSLGLVISARTLKGKIFGNEFEMGTGEAERQAKAAGAAEVAVVAEAKADQIAGQAANPPPTPAPAAPADAKLPPYAQ